MSRLTRRTFLGASGSVLALAAMGRPAFAQTAPAQTDENTSSAPATGAGVNTGAGTTRPKTEQELEADRLYEEAIMEEYAKREGGS